MAVLDGNLPLHGALRRSRSDRVERRHPRSEVVTHRALFTAGEPDRCDLCEERIGTKPGGSGLLLWVRGNEKRYEEPPLCERCGPAIAQIAMQRWEEEDEEEG